MKFEATEVFHGPFNEPVSLTIKPTDEAEPNLDIEVDGMSILDLPAETFDAIAERLAQYRARAQRTAA